MSIVMQNDENYTKGLAFELYDSFRSTDLSYVYHGLFTQKITDLIILLTEINMNRAGESAKIKKRVFSIMVESLQNITRHQDTADEYHGFFAIEQKNGNYFVTTVNLIYNKNINHVERLLNKIKSLTPEELKIYYKSVLLENQISEKGGAGLGLIEIARKSNNKVSYHFHPINNEYSYFYFHTCITPQEEGKTFDDTDLVQMDNIYLLHQLLKQNGVQIIFNGLFNQESLINLLNIIENQMAGLGRLKRVVFNLMVEMLQNIVKHAVKSIDKDGRHGIFFINKANNQYILNSGNYIHHREKDALIRKLEYVNKLRSEELSDYYNQCLFDFQVDNSKESGLGLIELRMKSNNLLQYDFYPVDSDNLFFTLKVIVDSTNL